LAVMQNQHSTMKITSQLIVLIFAVTSFTVDKNCTSIIWLDKLSGDFSFAKKQSISCDAWCYEWAGTKSVTAKLKHIGTVECYTHLNEATHCSLSLIISKDTCVPTIVLKSVVATRDKVYPYKTGYIKIDQTLWKQKILKAEFDFEFSNDENDKKIFWKGKIYTRIK